jgi:DNA gyrase/topoisomerase IV subunit A
MDIVTDDEQTLLVISEKGFGKKTKVANFPSHKRGGVGIKAAVVTAKTGPIISVQTIEPNMDEALSSQRMGKQFVSVSMTLRCLGVRRRA